MAINLQQKATGAGELNFISDATSRELFKIKERGACYSDLTSKVSLFDDFLGDVIADQWSAAEGNDAEAIIATINAQSGGVVRMVTGDTTVVSASAQSLTHGLNWKANAGNLVMEARVKLVSSIADVALFVGFTDVLATTTLEEPVTLSGTTFTTNATDATGFLFDTSATTDTLRAVGVANDVDATHVNTGQVPVVDTWHTYRVEVSTAGVATFYFDGALVATLSGAVTASVSLTPAIVAMARTTASKTVDVDYVFTQQDR